MALGPAGLDRLPGGRGDIGVGPLGPAERAAERALERLVLAAGPLWLIAISAGALAAPVLWPARIVVVGLVVALAGMLGFALAGIYRHPLQVVLPLLVGASVQVLGNSRGLSQATYSHMVNWLALYCFVTGALMRARALPACGAGIGLVLGLAVGTTGLMGYRSTPRSCCRPPRSRWLTV